MLFDEADGFYAVLALGNNVNVAYALQKIGELVAGELFVVDNQRG